MHNTTITVCQINTFLECTIVLSHFAKQIYLSVFNANSVLTLPQTKNPYAQLYTNVQNKREKLFFVLLLQKRIPLAAPDAVAAAEGAVADRPKEKVAVFEPPKPPVLFVELAAPNTLVLWVDPAPNEKPLALVTLVPETNVNQRCCLLAASSTSLTVGNLILQPLTSCYEPLCTAQYFTFLGKRRSLCPVRTDLNADLSNHPHWNSFAHSQKE